jgi:glutamate formiminotransferase
MQSIMPGAVVECVPNFSEGRDESVVRAIVNAMRVDGVKLLDWSMDEDHNRSVVTVAGAPHAVVESAVRGVGRAAELIDLTRQQGVHPRMGAADVVPFVPVQGVTLEQCALLARYAGEEIQRRSQVPVYFYGSAASRPDRANLEDVRRGQFEELRELVLRDPARCPDVGGPGLHPTAGATAVGARRFLVAFNIYFDTTDVSIVRSIAKKIRASSGGLPGVKAMGVMVRGQAQLSMNITDLGAVSIAHAYEKACELALQNRVAPVRTELIGLLPEMAFERNSEWMRLSIEFDPEVKVIERRLRMPMEWPDEAAVPAAR